MTLLRTAAQLALGGGGAPAVAYALRDLGNSGSIANGVAREANVGTWDTVTDSGGRATIATTLDFAGSAGCVAFAGGASLGWHDPSLVDPIARADVGAAVLPFRHRIGTSVVFHGLTATSKPAAPDDAGIGIHRIASNYELHLAMAGLGTTNVKPARQNKFIRNCVLYEIVVPRPTGYLLFMSGGSWGTPPEATLVWVYDSGTTDPLYVSHSAHTGEWQGRVQVIEPSDLPASLMTQYGGALAADTFTREDGALAGSPTEAGGLTWINMTNGTSTVASNKLAITGTGTTGALVNLGRVATPTDPIIIAADIERGAAGNLWLGLVLRADATGANRIQFNIDNTAWYLNRNGVDDAVHDPVEAAGQISSSGVTTANSVTQRIIAIDYGDRIKLFTLNKTTGVLTQRDGGNAIATQYGNTRTHFGVVRSTTSDTGANLIDNFEVWGGVHTLPSVLFTGHTAAPDITGAALFTDPFTGDDGTLLTTPWTLHGAVAVEIRSNKAQLLSDAAEGQATVDSGLTDVGVTANITIPGAGDPNFYGLFVRWTDVSNNLGIRILNQGGAPELEFEERVGGVSTMRQAVQMVTPLTLGGTYALKVVVRGNEIAAYFAGELMLVYDTTVTTGTRVGLGSSVGDAISAGTPTFDDFNVYAVA